MTHSIQDRVHFVGIAGTGMSALARYLKLSGTPVSGSDRAFDQGHLSELAERLRREDISLVPQDGSGVSGASKVVTSTAIEAEIEDLVVARTLGVPILHRAELLATLAAQRDSVAIAGSSGKSTVTAMVFTILAHAGLRPGLVTGAALVGLEDAPGGGTAVHDQGPLVFEADESDGSLVRYHPAYAVVLNLHRDHMEPAQVIEQYRTLISQVREGTEISDDPELAPLTDLAGVETFGLTERASRSATNFAVTNEGSTFDWDGVTVRVLARGHHNGLNAMAAMAVAGRMGVPAAVAAEGLLRFRGTERRFQIVGRAHGITVIDDYAHNPKKIEAALIAAQDLSTCVHAFFQPHGFGPTRFHREALVETFARILRTTDRLHLGTIYYAGGTVSKTIDSADLAFDLATRGRCATFGARDTWREAVVSSAREGDVVLVMGARDPALGAFTRSVAERVAHSR